MRAADWASCASDGGDPARAAGTAPRTVAATVTSGEVRLDVPEGSRFDLDAEAKRGETQAEFPGLAASKTEGEPGRGHRVTGQVGGGGAAVRLRADGDVVLESKPAGSIADRPVAKPPAVASAPPAEAVPAKPVAAPAKDARPAPEAPPVPEAPQAPEAPPGS